MHWPEALGSLIAAICHLPLGLTATDEGFLVQCCFHPLPRSGPPHLGHLWFILRYSHRCSVPLPSRYGRRRWGIIGSSYGTLIGALYASRFPERTSFLLLHGVFLGSRTELRWLYEEGGASRFYPEQWSALEQARISVTRNELPSGSASAASGCAHAQSHRSKEGGGIGGMGGASRLPSETVSSRCAHAQSHESIEAGGSSELNVASGICTAAASGNAATREARTVDAASGIPPIAASGEASTNDAATGKAATAGLATGEAAIGGAAVIPPGVPPVVAAWYALVAPPDMPPSWRRHPVPSPLPSEAGALAASATALTHWEVRQRRADCDGTNKLISRPSQQFPPVPSEARALAAFATAPTDREVIQTLPPLPILAPYLSVPPPPPGVLLPGCQPFPSPPPAPDPLPCIILRRRSSRRWSRKPFRTTLPR
jgi:hypothetical protein